MNVRSSAVALLAGLALAACTKSTADTATHDTATTDTGTADTAADTGTTDTGTTDTATTDTGTADTAADTGTTDTATDTGVTDTGTTDTGTTDTGVTDTGAQLTPSIAVSPAMPDLSTQLFVDHVVAADASQVVLNKDDCNTPGALVTHLALSKGTYRQVELSADTPFTTGLYCVSLHEDTVNTGSFNPSDDPLILNRSGQAVEATWQVTIAAGTPAVRVVLSHNGTSDYIFEQIVPDRFTAAVLGAATAPVDDPAVTLTLDWRYEVDWPSGHPFSIVSNTGTDQDPTDSPLLVPDAAGVLSTSGSLESDAGIDWVDDSAQTTEQFTATATLQGEPGLEYRCGNHSAMRGSLSIVAAR